MKRIATLFSYCCLFTASVMAGPPQTVTTTQEELPPVPLDLFHVGTSYVFESEIGRNHTLGDQDAFNFNFDYAHRFHLSGNLYLHTGVAYQRFDFGGDRLGRLPDQLQSAAAVLGIDYMHGEDVGAFIEFRPGFYTENDFDGSSFDVPITAARIWVLQPDKLYLLAGANVAFLRGRYPVIPFAGLIWKPTPQWSIFAILPEPRVIYSPTKKLDLWAGGQLVGGSFRTDHTGTRTPLDGAQVDYSEYRIGVGLDYKITNNFTADLGGGYAIERQFDFYRADRKFESDGAPYIRAALNAKF